MPTRVLRLSQQALHQVEEHRIDQNLTAPVLEEIRIIPAQSEL